MKNRRLTIALRVLLVALIILFASFLRLFSFRSAYYRSAVFLIICNIYAALLAAWSISIQRRIMHRRVRHYLLMVSLSLLLLIIFRILKNGIFEEYPFLCGYSWDLFFIPQLFIALFSYRAVQCLFIDERERISYKTKMFLGLPTHLLVFLIVTNPLHNFVINHNDDSHNVGYFIITAWILFLIILSLVRTINMAHTTVKKKIFVTIMFVLGVIWLVLYFIDSSKRGFGFVEYVAKISIITVALWESLIQLHIVPSNTEYEWCFTNSSVKGQIYDKAGKVKYRANDAISIPEETFLELQNRNSVSWDDNTELESNPIKGGSVIWEKDISEINGLIDELTETRDSISFAMETLREKISIEGRKHSLIEQNRLYDLIISNTDFQIALIEKYLENCEEADDETFIRIMREIAVFGSYIKRKSNLVLVSNEENADLYKEVQLAIKEIMNNVSKDKVECSCNFKGDSKLTIDVCLVMIDLFESILELSLPMLKKMVVITSGNNGDIRLTVCLTMKDNIFIRESFFKECFDRWEEVIEENFLGDLDLEKEDSDFIISMYIPAGLEASL